ncbi:MAG: DUF3887 domain-containing protein [Ruthenibacterium lactatiformans]
MKRTLSLALCLILSLALLAGCGAAPLPDGLTQESVTDAAAQTVAQLNDEDYDALFAGMTEEMTSAMTAEDLAAVWQPVLEAAGAFDSITKTTVGGKDGYGVAVVQAKYENAAVTFTLSTHRRASWAGCSSNNPFPAPFFFQGVPCSRYSKPPRPSRILSGRAF